MPAKFAFILLFPVLLLSGCRTYEDAEEDEEELKFQHGKLKQFLEAYQEIYAKGGWPALSTGTLAPGDRKAEVPLLRKRLMITGELSPKSQPVLADSFDHVLAAAVRRFQRNHGLDANGIVNAQTISELNIPVEYRLLQLALNIDRWKSFRNKDEKDYIFVNIADYSLEAVEDDSTRLRMNVVVGKRYRQTPTFSKKMTEVEFNPRWHLPPTILKEDVLPKIKADTSYLRTNNMLVYDQKVQVDPASVDWEQVSADEFRYSLVRQPGAGNPLGIVKFLFPNKHAVYMHDTPEKESFRKKKFVGSSGCIRLSDARALARYIMKRDRGWPPGRVDSLIATGETKRLKLKDPIKVHIQYITAWVEANGDLQFRRDIYGRDVRQKVDADDKDLPGEKKLDKKEKQTERRNADW